MIIVQYRSFNIHYLHIHNLWSVRFQGLEKQFHSLSEAQSMIDRIIELKPTENPVHAFLAFSVDRKR